MVLCNQCFSTSQNGLVAGLDYQGFRRIQEEELVSELREGRYPEQGVVIIKIYSET